MRPIGYALFDTALGACGVVWSEGGICGVLLPEGSAEATRARLEARFEGAPEATAPPEVADAMAAMTALLRGERVDLSSVRLDLEGLPELYVRAYEIARAIPAGSTLTYGEIASRLGQPGAARVVGQAMGKNPVPVLVPCHRVLGAGGQIGGFSAPGGSKTKRRMLAIEGAATGETLSLFDD